jgi:hypothetical protein
MSLWSALGVDFEASKMVFKPASAIEARSGETGTGSTVGESAVPLAADAPNSSPKEPNHV